MICDDDEMRTRILILESILILVFVYQQPSGVLATAEKYFSHQELPSFTDLYLICCQLSEISRSWVCYKIMELEHVVEAVCYWSSPTHTASNKSDLYRKTGRRKIYMEVKHLKHIYYSGFYRIFQVVFKHFQATTRLMTPSNNWYSPRPGHSPRFDPRKLRDSMKRNLSTVILVSLTVSENVM